MPIICSELRLLKLLRRSFSSLHGTHHEAQMLIMEKSLFSITSLNFISLDEYNYYWKRITVKKNF